MVFGDCLLLLSLSARSCLHKISLGELTVGEPKFSHHPTALAQGGSVEGAEGLHFGCRIITCMQHGRGGVNNMYIQTPGTKAPARRH